METDAEREKQLQEDGVLDAYCETRMFREKGLRDMQK
jgi:hypothetical protein